MMAARGRIDTEIHTGWHRRRCPRKGKLGNGGRGKIEAGREGGCAFDGGVHGRQRSVCVVAPCEEYSTTTVGVNFKGLRGTQRWPIAQHADALGGVGNGRNGSRSNRGQGRVGGKGCARSFVNFERLEDGRGGGA